MKDHIAADQSCHMSHCNQGEYDGGCKYGEADTCPAFAADQSGVDELKGAPDRIFLIVEDDNGKNPFKDFESASKAASLCDGLLWCEDRQGPSDIEYVLAQPAAVEPANNGGEIPTAPDHCPITGRKFWGNIDHPDFGMVATYGGPFDTYTIPKPDEDGEFRCEQFDQDAGDWVEGGCPTGLWLADEQPSAAPSPVVAEPAAVDAEAILQMVEEAVSKCTAAQQHYTYAATRIVRERIRAGGAPAATVGEAELDSLRKLFVELTNSHEVCESGAVVGHVILNEQLDRFETLLAQQPAASDVRDAKHIGVMEESGVRWFGTNPHGHPVGTNFYASQSAPAVQADEGEAS